MKAATTIICSDVNSSVISIHAAREGGDPEGKNKMLKTYISIHAAREGGDCGMDDVDLAEFKFQSTPPVKAATFARICPQTSAEFQSTPPVKAATGLNAALL